ncbi:MAG: dethiobiotin synthase [Desulfobacterales bacterium]|nr:dethiobiotin synthase [Desulfobacterales bacterium]MCP4162860.1 dethiobiotin synthase [Deltaproteobacteria bacterium]
MQCKHYVVVGTDTEIGKTVVSLILMKQLINNGDKPVYVKPFQTGCKDVYDTDSDALFIYENLNIKDWDISKSVINCNKNPKAPYFAARDDNEVIDIKNSIKSINDLTKDFTHSVIEMSGGIFVPITDKILVADFINELDCEVVLAGRAGLGTINHTLLSIEALISRGMKPARIVLVDKDGSTDLSMIDENIEVIEVFSGIKANKIGKIDNFNKIENDFTIL